MVYAHCPHNFSRAMSDSSFLISYGVILISTYLFLYLSIYDFVDTASHEDKSDVDRWLRENSFEPYKKLLESQGRYKILDMASIDAMPLLTGLEEDRVKRASLSLKEKLIFAQYLKYLNLHEYFQPMVQKGVSSLEDVYSQNDGRIHEILGNDFARWARGRQMLPSTKEALETFKTSLWRTLVTSEETERTTKIVWFRGCLLIFSAFFAGILTFIYKYQLWSVLRTDRTLLHVLTGRYLEPKMCLVHFHWSDPYPVGETLTFTIEFFQKNGLPYPVCDKDEVQVEITLGVRRVHSVVSLGGTATEDVNVGQVKFSVRYAGIYLINIMVSDEPVPGSPFTKKFLPGPVDPTKTRFARQTSTVICCPDETRTLVIEPRDAFQNLCISRNVEESSNYVDLDSYHSVVKQDGVEKLDVCFQSFSWDQRNGRIFFEMTFLEEGYYNVQVYYHDVLIQNGDFTSIVLSHAEFQEVLASVKNRHISYDVMLTRIEGEPCFKPKKVHMHITPKQFTVRELVLRFLMKRIATYRVCPSTKLQILEETCNSVPTFSVEDGSQPTIYLAAFNRNVIVATYSRVLLNNIGGSETFTEKQYFFYCEVRRYHQKFRHEPLTIKVDRQKLLQSSFKATKNFTLKDWCSSFEVVFQGEIGVDWGGLRREWFQLTCEALFNPGPGNLFRGFNDNSQALVHPNKYRTPHLKLKYYEFAGRLLGKSLYETALGGSYSQFITAKFTRSFLAQLIGLRVNHSYFQSDDPDLYISKVQYILDNDVSNMDLHFTDEEYNCNNGQLIGTIDLMPNGSKIKVTNSTKRQYLDQLAQYRLATSVKEEIEAFLKGLNEIIPDNFLCMFDENELELLLCGTGEYSVSDFRAHHVVNSPFPRASDFDRILKWFWVAISNFTTEEMARLLQFTTGSSQLPPGGFKDLNPQFQIMPALTYGNLPTAHTCFNQLCLPDYDTYEQFEKSLLLAITEGSAGFGLI